MQNVSPPSQSLTPQDLCKSGREVPQPSQVVLSPLMNIPMLLLFSLACSWYSLSDTQKRIQRFWGCEREGFRIRSFLLFVCTQVSHSFDPFLVQVQQRSVSGDCNIHSCYILTTVARRMFYLSLGLVGNMHLQVVLRVNFQQLTSFRFGWLESVIQRHQLPLVCVLAIRAVSQATPCFVSLANLQLTSMSHD